MEDIEDIVSKKHLTIVDQEQKDGFDKQTQRLTTSYPFSSDLSCVKIIKPQSRREDSDVKQ